MPVDQRRHPERETSAPAQACAPRLTTGSASSILRVSGGTRTLTPVRALAPQTSVSAIPPPRQAGWAFPAWRAHHPSLRGRTTSRRCRPSRRSAVPESRRRATLVAPTGFEPVASAVRVRRPQPSRPWGQVLVAGDQTPRALCVPRPPLRAAGSPQPRRTVPGDAPGQRREPRWSAVDRKIKGQCSGSLWTAWPRRAALFLGDRSVVRNPALPCVPPTGFEPVPSL